MSNVPLDRTSNADNSTHSQATRRDFLKTSAAAAAATTAPFWFATTENPAKAFQGPNNRHVLGCIGTGSRWEGDDGPRAMKFADCVAVCDVDAAHAEKGRQIVEKIQSKKGRMRSPMSTAIIAAFSTARTSTS